MLVAVLAAAGLLTGAQFPLALSLYLRKRSERVGAGAGAVDTADHLGAACGAALAGVLFTPVFGLVLTAILLVCFKIASLVVIARN